MKIGSCRVDEDGNILKLKREYHRQGWIFKDEEAFKNEPDSPCYVPELSDSVYTGSNFLKICNGQQEFAEELFDGVDWQHPETLKEEWIAAGEWANCEKCGKLINTGEDDADICPFCGEKIEEE